MSKENYCISEDKMLTQKGLIKEYQPHNKPIYSLSITPNKEYIITGSLDKKLKVWHLETGEEFQAIEGHENEITSLHISSDGGRIVSGSEDKTVKLWKLETGNLMRNFTNHEGPILDVLITPNDKYIISVSEDKTAKIWNWNSKQVIKTYTDENLGFSKVAISSEGKKLVLSSGRTIHLLNWGEKEPFLSIEGHKYAVSTVIICPKDEYIITGSLDKTVKIWDLTSGEMVKCLEGSHQGVINSVSISNDRRYIASGSGDKSLIVWDINNDFVYGPFHHDSYIQCVKFIPETHLVLAADYSGRVKVWDFLGECIDLKRGLSGTHTAIDISEDLSKKLTIFISYATADSDKYDIPRIGKLLQNAYPDVENVLFWEESMDDDIYVYMNDNLGLADIVLVFCSENATHSDAVRAEWMAAYKMKKKIIPIFEHEQHIPPLLTTKLGLEIDPYDIKGFIRNLHLLIKKKTKNLR
ncbi:MAG: hypothetical protein BAJALOKI1v1_1970006 [Promethearchaeota archaeon]|nr:MAG: hypothetical protein BAJALOKI1v1_1970006 [Candidatus Lokiarchaeota archaeon]